MPSHFCWTWGSHEYVYGISHDAKHPHLGMHDYIQHCAITQNSVILAVVSELLI